MNSIEQIALKELQFSYNPKSLNPILESINAQFGKGHLYGILGPNGCGKTTLLNIMSGILTQKQGEIIINSESISNWSYKERAKNIAYVQQKTIEAEFDFTVEDIIMMGRYSYINRFSQSTHEDKQKVQNIIKDFSLEALKDRRFDQLSGGEQQKVMVARAFAQEAKILLLDEPISHLDINFQLEFMSMFKRIIAQGIIVIVVLHDLNLAAQFCDSILFLKDGRIQSFGSVEATMTTQNIWNIYNINTVIKRSPITNSIYVIPIHQHDLKQLEGDEEAAISSLYKKKIHMFAGGGVIQTLLPKLTQYILSVGVVPVLDDDFTLAQQLEVDIISEAPFSSISDRSKTKLRDQLDISDIIILPEIPFGNGNVANLEILAAHEKEIPIYIIENTSFESRDFTSDNHAQKMYSEICKKDLTVLFEDENALLFHIKNIKKMK